MEPYSAEYRQAHGAAIGFDGLIGSDLDYAAGRMFLRARPALSHFVS
jgi:hypothetical protein